jgi:two-component sensor histidine kinase
LWIAAPCAFENFTDFERRLNETIAGRPIICLCSYCLGKTQATDVLDVVRYHEFALARREGEWEVVESAALKVAKSRLVHANEDLERKVSERTAHLQDALADKEVLLREVHHRVNNNLQVISSLMLLKSKELAAAGARHVLDDVLRRINAISLVHETLYLEEDSRGIDVSAYLADLARTLVASYGLETQVRIAVSTTGGFLGLTEAVPVSLIATEVITHALRHRRPDASASALDIAYAEEAAGPVLTVRDTIAPPCASGQPHAGLAVALIDKLAAQVDGRVAYDCDGETNVFTLRFPPA